jgi:hypothetical protein
MSSDYNLIGLYAILTVDEYSPEFGLDASTALSTGDRRRKTEEIKELAFYRFI